MSMAGTEALAMPRRHARFAQSRLRYLLAATMILLCLLIVLPLVAAVLALVKTPAEAAAVPPTYLPHALSLDSYQRLWAYQAGMLVYLWNSFATAMLAIGFTLALGIPAGFALARFPIPGREAVFVLLLMALIVPYQALLTPTFLMFAKLGLTNSVVGLAIIHTAIQFPFSIYILRNGFEAVPRELEEAAVVDGCTPVQVLIRIALPLVLPAVITVSLFAFIQSWNEFLGALVMMSRQDAFTLPLILAAARTETSLGGTDWGMLQAGVVISIVPCVAIYLLLQKYYVAGLLAGAVK
jgi:multiple sugar transport system permease protein